MRKLKLFFAALALFVGGVSSVYAQASYNKTWTAGNAVAEGQYFLYNIGAGKFLDNGMNWGTRATVDNAGKELTLALSNGKYTINGGVKTRYGGNGAGDYLNDGGYMDGAAFEWTFNPVNLDGYTNVYTLSAGSNYLVYQTDAQGENPACNVVALSGTNNDYWLLITKAQREAVKDYTFMLDNTCFNRPWENKAWTLAVISTGTDGNGTPDQSGGNVANRCAESYRNAFTYLQDATGTVVDGRYKLYNQGFYRLDGGSGAAQIVANNDAADMKVLNANGENTAQNMTGASNAFSAGQYVNSVETFVNNGSLSVGIKNNNNMNWVIWDNFYLEYLGQCVMDYAVALPVGGAMEADTWYYFDITAAADNYTATATTLDDIICTTDGYTLTSAATGNVTLTAKDNDFAVQRYYVKSSSANNLKIGVSSYSYTVGAATPSIADAAYIGSLTTISFDFALAQTNDPDATFALLDNSATASLKLNGNEVATGALEVSGTTLTATFSNVALTQSSTYTIEIAAGVVGYAGQETNAAISTTVKTGIIADGVYYFKKKGEYKYLTRGGNYGTETVVDNYGISFAAAIQPSGAYFMKNVDHSLAANADKYLNAYTDQGAYAWTIAEATGGYYIKDVDGKFLTTSSVAYTDNNGNTNTYYYQSRTENEAEAITWELLTKAEYTVTLTAKKNAEISALATAAGIDGVTTLAGLETALSSNFGTTDMTDKIANAQCNSASGWTAVSYNGGSKYESVDYHAPTIQIYNRVGGITQTVESLPKGLYKVTVSATWRPGNSEAATRAGNEANTTAWIYANDNITQLKGWYEGGGTINSTQNLVDNAASYLNTVYAYVDNSGTLSIGVAVPSFCEQNWCPIYNWTLTRYEAKATQAEKDALANAISAAEAKTLGFETGEYAPYNNVAALEALTAANAIDPDVASGVAVVAATTALTGATWTVNAAEVNAFAYGDFTTYETIDGKDYPYGWNLYNGTDGNYSRIMGGTENSNAGVTGKALLLKWNATYGETNGYTMPLKDATVYKITFKYCGWGGNTPQTHVVMTDPNGTDITLNPVFKPATGDGQADASHWYDFTGYFVSTTAGDYKFNLNKVESGQQQIAIADIDLRSTADALEFADGSVPTYAPGTYPAVKISRTLTANRWATAVYPFAVSGVDNIAVLDSFDEDVLGFTSANSSEANKPFLMRSTTDDVTEINLSNVAVVATDDEPVVTKGNAQLKGVYTETTVGEGTNATNYVLSNNVIYPVVENSATVTPYRAYIQVAQTGGAARTLRFAVDGEATAIEGITASESNSGEIYNLQGQRVMKAQKGLFIQNGKKVVVK